MLPAALCAAVCVRGRLPFGTGSVRMLIKEVSERKGVLDALS